MKPIFEFLKEFRFVAVEWNPRPEGDGLTAYVANGSCDIQVMS